MAVTPVLQNINAFDVTEGTTIYFSVNGSTEFIRSSVVTFTDNETGLDVATNTYSTTQLYNIIPPDLDGIKNGKQYSVRVDVFTQIDPSGHESAGTSIAKPVWCLPSPTLEFTAPSGAGTTNIEVSSYTFSATFTMYNDASLVSKVLNRVQSYTFDLYNGTLDVSSMVESSGTIYGTGTHVTDTEYILEHTFNGLLNNNSYYVILTITTEQGMGEKSISSYILPMLSDISFAVAEVRYNSCKGYIEVQSNITTISGYTNAPFDIGEREIDLTNAGDFVVWGYDPITGNREYSISFPTTDWSILISAKNLIPSIGSAIINGDESFLLRLASYDLLNFLSIYARSDGTNFWVELYIKDNINKDNILFIQSNFLTNVTDSTPIYILLRYIEGHYDIKISTELGS